ncbi:MAG: hypothetical protein ACMG6E_04040, partial [Candidatus Roizmanbacteria bacterium]
VDTVISRYDPLYKRHLRAYLTGVSKRNRIIEKAYAYDRVRSQLVFWDTFLMEHADYITKAREEFVEELQMKDCFPKLHFFVEYQPNRFTEKRIKETEVLQVRYRNTIIGPQRDDYDILFVKNGGENSEKKSVLKYGSRSQQRLALLWINFFELDKYFSSLEKKPLLLLDDVFSELDEENKKLVLEVISSYQTVITTNDKSVTDYVAGEYGEITLN